jgi:hypothetical protein
LTLTQREALSLLVEKGTVMTKEEMFEVFGDFDPSKYEDEAREGWGHSEAYQESARRTARYTKKDWVQIKAEGEQLQRELAAELEAGRAPTEPAVMELAERHRAYITRWFYAGRVPSQLRARQPLVGAPMTCTRKVRISRGSCCSQGRRCTSRSTVVPGASAWISRNSSKLWVPGGRPPGLGASTARWRETRMAWESPSVLQDQV